MRPGVETTLWVRVEGLNCCLLLLSSSPTCRNRCYLRWHSQTCISKVPVENALTLRRGCFISHVGIVALQRVGTKVQSLWVGSTDNSWVKSGAWRRDRYNFLGRIKARFLSNRRCPWRVSFSSSEISFKGPPRCSPRLSRCPKPPAPQRRLLEALLQGTPRSRGSAPLSGALSPRPPRRLAANRNTPRGQEASVAASACLTSVSTVRLQHRPHRQCVFRLPRSLVWYEKVPRIRYVPVPGTGTCCLVQYTG